MFCKGRDVVAVIMMGCDQQNDVGYGVVVLWREGFHSNFIDKTKIKRLQLKIKATKKLPQ